MEKTVKIKPRMGVKIILIFIILLVILFIYARYINTKGFVIKEVAVVDQNLSSSYNGFKIVHFSDIHYGRTILEEDMKAIVQAINDLKPDVLVFTGDLFDTKKISSDDEKMMIRYFEQLEARLFKLAVIGDYDQEYIDVYQNILSKSDFILLDNQAKIVYDQAKVPINFVGLTNTTSISELYNHDYFTITLVHQPDLVKNISQSNLVLAGHSLGGQIKIPFIGGIIKKDGARTYLEDYYQIDDTQLYISNGLGTEKFSFRTFNKPSITLYRLYNY